MSAQTRAEVASYAQDTGARVHRRVIAALTRRFGIDQFALIEDAVQEAYVRAAERWGGTALAHTSEGWLLRVAHNIIIDVLRRERRLVPLTNVDDAAADGADDAIDDELRLIFLCCHPSLPTAAQISLTLRVGYGFTTGQIARAFLSDERTIAQRIVRAKQRLRDEGARFDLPGSDEVPGRLDSILNVLYQLFAEAYASTASQAGIDDALCRESLRLVRLITNDPRVTSPSAESLRALFCFQVARLPARVASDGGLLLLHEQDRTLWDRSLISEGFVWLAKSARGTTMSRFHAEAGIAACHAVALSHDATDWPRILWLYDALRKVAPSPVVDVNRAFAVAMCQGAKAGLDELDAIPERDLVARYPYACALYSDLRMSLGHIQEAREQLERALQHQPSPAERALLRRKRAALR
jgi:RNA polymerase sigma factor (sigma-70 family)